MKSSVKSLLAAFAFGACALVGTAQTPKIMVVDMANLFDNHYKKLEQDQKLRGDEQKAQEELEKLNAEGNQLVEQYKEFAEQAKNPALSDDAKAKAEQEAQAKLEEIQRKQNEVQTFRVNTQRTLQQRIQNFRGIMLEEIGKIATDVAKRQGASLLIDKSGPSLIGIAPLIYADPSMDITEAVAAEINKSRPAGAPTAPASPAPTTSGSTPTTADEPSVSFPGAKKN